MALKNKLRRLKVPKTVYRGDVFTVKTMAEHEMETGVRMDPVTKVIYSRFIIAFVECRYNGKLVFSADWFSGVSANPFLAFKLRAEESGTIEIKWIDDYNQPTYATAEITVLDRPDDDVSEAIPAPRDSEG